MEPTISMRTSFLQKKKVAYSTYAYFQCKTKINHALPLDFGYLSHTDTALWLGKGSCSSVTLWLLLIKTLVIMQAVRVWKV